MVASSDDLGAARYGHWVVARESDPFWWCWPVKPQAAPRMPYRLQPPQLVHC